jgi:hypothetical protein
LSGGINRYPAAPERVEPPSIVADSGYQSPRRNRQSIRTQSTANGMQPSLHARRPDTRTPFRTTRRRRRAYRSRGRRQPPVRVRHLASASSARRSRRVQESLRPD